MTNPAEERKDENTETENLFVLTNPVGERKDKHNTEQRKVLKKSTDVQAEDR